MKNIEKPYTFDRVVRIVIALVLLGSAGWIINKLSGVLLPFIIAWLIAYLVYPIVIFVEQKMKIRYRIPSIIITLFFLSGTIAGLIYLLKTPIINEIERSIGMMNDFLNRPSQSEIIPTEWLDTIKERIKSIDFDRLLTYQNIESAAAHLLPKAWTILSGSFSILWKLTIVFLVLLYLIFILNDYEKLSDSRMALIPKKYHRFVQGLFNDVTSGMNAYFRGQGLIALIVGLLSAIGFKIIHLPIGISFGLFVGVLNLVPYLPTLSAPIAILLAAIKAVEYNQNFWLVLLSVVIVFAIIQAIQDLFLTPKILGNATGLKPAIVLLSLSIFGSLFGLLGMIIALPSTSLLISYYKRFVIDRESMTDEENEEGEDSSN